MEDSIGRLAPKTATYPSKPDSTISISLNDQQAPYVSDYETEYYKPNVNSAEGLEAKPNPDEALNAGVFPCTISYEEGHADTKHQWDKLAEWVNKKRQELNSTPSAYPTSIGPSSRIRGLKIHPAIEKLNIALDESELSYIGSAGDKVNIFGPTKESVTLVGNSKIWSGEPSKTAFISQEEHDANCHCPIYKYPACTC